MQVSVSLGSTPEARTVRFERSQLPSLGGAADQFSQEEVWCERAAHSVAADEVKKSRESRNHVRIVDVDFVDPKPQSLEMDLDQARNVIKGHPIQEQPTLWEATNSSFAGYGCHYLPVGDRYDFRVAGASGSQLQKSCLGFMAAALAVDRAHEL